MDIKKAGKQLLSTLAPLVGTALGGPFGGIAGKTLANSLGVAEVDVASILQSPNPEQVTKIKEAEHEFEKFMREADIQEQELSARDRDSARNMALKTSLRPQMALSLVYTGGYFLVLFGLMAEWITIPAGNEQLMAGLIGVLTAGQVKVLDFFLGSSAGSKAKFSHPANYKGE